jgi:hypothetical protein
MKAKRAAAAFGRAALFKGTIRAEARMFPLMDES